MKKTSRIILGLVLILLAAGGITWGVAQILDLSAAPSTGTADVIKILVDHEGLYSITAADMRRFGWENVNPADLALSVSGSDYPFTLLGEGRDLQLVFYGRPPASPFNRYTPFNAYFLSQRGGASQSPVEIMTGGEGGAETVNITLRLEENRVYSPRLEEGRPWFWLQLPAPGSQRIEFEIDPPAAGEGTLTMEWFGSTSSMEADPDHHLRILLNGTQIADPAWDGAGPKTIEARFNANLLLEGPNTLLFEAPGDTGVPADIVLLDYVLLTYPGLPSSENSSLSFLADQGYVQFAEPVILLDVNHPEEITALMSGPGALPTVPGETYLAVFEEAFETPARLLTARFEPDLRRHTGADYVAIGSPDLLEALQPLLAHRESQGLSTAAIPSEDIFDQFGDGLALPHAIRAFLQFAAENWANPPAYVLLVGDWSYDPHGYISQAVENGLPSFLSYTQYGGETVSDIEFAKLDGDAWPDLALGRLPARTAGQVTTAVNKTIAFETSPPAAGGWETHVLAIADPTEASFKADAENYLAGFEPGFEPVLIAPENGEADTAQQITDRIQSGVLLMSYFGHGSITQLGKDSLFDAEHAAALKNGAYTPIMVNITCLAGLFTHPTVDSLSEVMLWTPEGGAVAALGATSLTLPFFQAYLSGGFADALVAMPGARIGDVLLLAQRQVPVDDPGGLEVLDTFLLFGDPGLIMP